MIIEESNPDRFKPAVDVFLATYGRSCRTARRRAGGRTAVAGFSVERSADRKLKRALEVANKTGARFTLILGDDEVSTGTYSIKGHGVGRASEADTLRARGAN